MTYPIQVDIVTIAERRLYSDCRIGYAKDFEFKTERVTPYVFDLALVKSFRKSGVFLDGDWVECVFVELDNSHDVCFMHSYDLFLEKYHKTFKPVEKW
jgi:hypothetical protein